MYRSWKKLDENIRFQFYTVDCVQENSVKRAGERGRFPPVADPIRL